MTQCHDLVKTNKRAPAGPMRNRTQRDTRRVHTTDMCIRQLQPASQHNYSIRGGTLRCLSCESDSIQRNMAHSVCCLVVPEYVKLKESQVKTRELKLLPLQ